CRITTTSCPCTPSRSVPCGNGAVSGLESRMSSTETPPPPKSWFAVLLVGIAVVYFVAGKVGLDFFGLLNPSASAVWPPTGVAIASLLLFGYRAAGAVFVGAFLVNYTTAGGMLASLGIAAGNTLEGVVAAYLVTR